MNQLKTEKGRWFDTINPDDEIPRRRRPPLKDQACMEARCSAMGHLTPAHSSFSRIPVEIFVVILFI